MTIAGYTYRSTIGVMGGRSMIPVSAENRAAAGVAAGDEVEVDVALDTESREVSVPADLAEALAADEDAKRSFEKMSYSHKQRWVLHVTEAKTAETRQRRIVKAIDAIRSS